MISIDPLKRMIECALVSPYIKGEKPIRLLIVAKAESGKTSAMKMYRENRGVCYLTDCTAYGLTRDILPKLVSGEVKTLMIADLLTPLSRSTKTRKNFVAFLNNFIEEGLAKVTTYATIWEKEVRGNLITAVTDAALLDGRREWAGMGFLSRFVLFSYSYPISTVYKILDYYSDVGVIEMREKVRLPKDEVNVHLSKELADKLNPVSMKIGETMDLYGIRAKINFRSLLKCLAFLRGGREEKEVEEKDFDEFLYLSNWMNVDLNPL